MNFPDYTKFVNKVKDSLEDHNVVYVQSLFNDNRNFSYLKNNCWDLVPIVTKYLSPNIENDNIDLFKGCEELIGLIAQHSNPEEALLQFIEEIEESVDDTKFVALLFPMLKVLQRIPKNRLNSLAWCLNAIQTYLNKIDCSSNEVSFRVEILYFDVIRFYDIVIPYYYDNLKSMKDFGLVISKHLIELLGKPLGYLNMMVSEQKTRIRKIAENILEKILLILKDPYLYFEMESNDFLVPSAFSYGIFLYLIICEKINNELIPKVHDICYVFYSSLNYIVALLRSDQELVVEKGLNTAEIMLQSNLNMSYFVLALEVNKEFCEVLENIIVFNELEKCRKQAFRIFQLYLSSFEVRGQYLLLYNLVPKIKHSGLAGFTIIQYKEILVNLEKNKNADLEYFGGKKLYSFINKCCDITKEDEYNLMNVADKTMSILNLMRFVVLQEKIENLNHFKKIVRIWRSKYLDRLSILLEESMQNFKKKKQEIENEKSEQNQELNLSVGGEFISEMSKSEKIHNIDLSLTGFEMIDSLLNRLIELLKLKNCYD